MELRSRIKEWIVRSGYTNERLAEELGVSRETVSKWANSKSFPGVKTLWTLSRKFGCKVDELYEIIE
ncbi:helix-turn-helix transcriptional regulator [Ornithinibacillus scapharcae]|uniref:helix-turn-helix transcriptional regulator n=1 Tax=Ornithinibacillus scapharcae TaxID=1147159 RepID=UPI000225B053|nr:helix-turn-helix transcriptional regulator [Ornithinibacillus scapharcae]